MGTRMKQIRLIETRMITDFNTEMLYHFFFQVSGLKFQVLGFRFLNIELNGTRMGRIRLAMR